jgi:glutamate racemase
LRELANEQRSNGSKAADVLVLGCTHYPLLKPLLHRVLPEAMLLVDSAEATAHDAAARLGLRTKPSSRDPKVEFFATDSVDKFQILGTRFFGQQIDRVELIALPE